MEKLNFDHWKQLKRQWTRTGALCTLGLCLPQIAPVVHAQVSVVQKEINRRLTNARQANELLQQGDAAYNKQDYKAAVNDYSRAFELLPGGSMNLELRAAAADRYATAATERSRQLAKGGRYDEAKILLSQVLKPEIAPAHLGALKLTGQINDPTRYNHALTRKHVQNVQKVGIALREADGFYSLGQYDRALLVYRDVLRIDPFNKAARRGMENIESTKSDYYRASYDHTRAKLLGAVDKEWELAIPPTLGSPDFVTPGIDATFAPSLQEKLAGINVDTINLDAATLSEALDYVRIQSRKGDAPSVTGEKNGINIVLTLGDETEQTAKAILASRVHIKANNLPLSKLLDYITDQTHTQWRSDGASILITPLGSTSEVIISRTFTVPPNFLSSAAAKTTEDSSDIFASDSDSSEGMLPTQISITDFLKQSGVHFPAGSGANYSPHNNVLTVRNTPSNLDIVDQLVSLISSQAPVLVVIRTTITRVSEKKLKALSFDWMISPATLGKGLHLGGGTVGNGTQLSDMPLNPFSGLGSPITSGTRSGTTGLHADSIDTFLNSANSGFGGTEIRSPGILTLTGVYSGVQVQMMMRGLDQQTGADVMAKPTMIARSGERARVEIIREFIYPTEYEPPELPNSVGISDNGDGSTEFGSASFPVTPAHPTAFEIRNVGITLEVEPTVGPNKQFIELSLKPEMVEFQGFVNYGTPISGNPTEQNPLAPAGALPIITPNNILMPIFKITRLKNQTVTIQDGATIVLGGVMTSRKTKIEDKVPILGDVPIVGRLFRSEADKTYNEAVIITVQAELVDPAGIPWKGR